MYWLAVRHSRNEFSPGTYSDRGEIVHSTSIRSSLIRGGGGLADQKAHTVPTISITPQRQYFVACCPTTYVSHVFGLRSICVCFPSTLKFVT
jgi:hypothetical protein